MNENPDYLEHLFATAEAFLCAIRSGEGYQEHLFQDLCAAIYTCGTIWRESDSIPKRAANLFVDLASGIESSSYAYTNAHSMEAIQKAADIIGALVREAVT